VILALLLTVVTDIESIARRIDSVVGVAAKNLATGATIELRADERFPMGSVYKLAIGLEVVRRAEEGRLDLARSITIHEFSPGHSPIRDAAKGKPVTMTLRQLLDAMVRDSDNTACDHLLAIVTPPAVTKRMRDIGVSGIRVDRTEKTIAAAIDARGVADYAKDPRDTATPRAAIALLEHIARSPARYESLWHLMLESRRNRIKELLPATVIAGHKSGQMPGTRNDVGIVRVPNGPTILIAVFTRAGVTSDEDVRGAVISQIAKRIYDEWVR
jgi:beta-lactamase class A